MKNKRDSKLPTPPALASANGYVADLEECLAGFMITAGINGAYLDDEMKAWAAAKLHGKQRTPVQVWREIAKAT